MRVGNISSSVLPPAAFISAETGLRVVNRAGVAAGAGTNLISSTMLHQPQMDEIQAN